MAPITRLLPKSTLLTKLLLPSCASATGCQCHANCKITKLLHTRNAKLSIHHSRLIVRSDHYDNALTLIVYRPCRSEINIAKISRVKKCAATVHVFLMEFHNPFYPEHTKNFITSFGHGLVTLIYGRLLLLIKNKLQTT